MTLPTPVESAVAGKHAAYDQSSLTFWWALRRLFIMAIGLLFPAVLYLKGPGFDPFAPGETLILFILVGFLTISPLVVTNTSRASVNAGFIVLLSFLLLHHVVMAVHSPDWTAALASFLLHDKYIAVAVLIPLFVVTRNDEQRLLQLLLAVGGLTVYISLVAIAKDPSVLITLVVGGSFRRATSLFPNPNMYGVYLATLAFLALAYATFVASRAQMVIAAVAVGIPGALMLTLTFSRRAWLMLILGLGIFLLFKRGPRLRGLVVVAGMIGCILLFIGTESVEQRFTSIFDSEYTSNVVRVAENAEQVQFLLSDPLVLLGGAGVGQAGPAGALSGTERWLTFHNYFMQVLVEFGLVGLLLYVAVFLFACGLGARFLWRSYLTDSDFNRLLVYVIALVSLFGAGLVGSTPIAFPTSMLQWVVMGLVLRAGGVGMPERRSLREH